MLKVADCGTKEFTDQKRMAMSVSEFIDGWVNILGFDSGGDDGKPMLYLKDWHFVKVCQDCSFFFVLSVKVDLIR